MKLAMFSDGTLVKSLEELGPGYTEVRIAMIMETTDIPTTVMLYERMPISRDTFVELVTTLAYVSGKRVPAIAWVRKVTEWGLKEARYFVDSLRPK